MQEHRLAVGIHRQRLGRQVGVDAAGNRIGHAQRGRGKVAGRDFRVYPAFEIAVAREHHHAFQALFGEGLDMAFEAAGITDAGHAAKARQVETQRGEILQQAGGFQVIGHHP
eukprot:gene22341-biopygen12604